MRRLILFSAIIVSVLVTYVIAQEIENTSTINTNERDLDLVLSYEMQDPGTKEFYIIASIESKIDTDRVVVDWDFPRRINLANEMDSPISRTDVYEGQTSTVKKLVKPTASGEYEVKAVVTGVKADVNYISSDNIIFEFNDNLEIVPLSKEYKKAKLIHQITQVVFYLLIALAVGGIVYFIYIQIKKIRA